MTQHQLVLCFKTKIESKIIHWVKDWNNDSEDICRIDGCHDIALIEFGLKQYKKKEYSNS